VTEYVDRDVQRLLHMIQGVKRLGRMLAGKTKDDFLYDEVLQAAALFEISTIGESAARVSEALQARHPEIPWGQMRGMRNRIVHIFDYEQIDYDIIWNVAVAELSEMESKLRTVLSEIPLPDDFTLPEV